MTDEQKRKLRRAAVLVPFQVISAVLARRDMARRTDVEIRGSRKFWRLFVMLNPGNSLLYWLFGRRRSPAPA